VRLSVICLDNFDTKEKFANQTFSDFEVCQLPHMNIDICSFINEKVLNISSDYILFAHSEVKSKEDRFERQVDYLDKNEEVAVGGIVDILDEDDRGLSKIYYPTDFVDCYQLFYLFKKEFVFDYATMLKRKAFLEVGGLNRTIRRSKKTLQSAIFLSLWARFLQKNYRIANLDIPVVQCVPEVIVKHELHEEEKNLLWGAFRRKRFKIQPLVKSSTELFEMI